MAKAQKVPSTAPGVRLFCALPDATQVIVEGVRYPIVGRLVEVPPAVAPALLSRPGQWQVYTGQAEADLSAFEAAGRTPQPVEA